MEETINLQEIFQTLKKRFVLIISIILGALILSSVVTFFIITPSYEASTQILVNQSQSEGEELSSSDIQSSRELINTYNVIITSPAILAPVIEASNFDGSMGELRSKINVEAEEESQVATVTVEDTDPQSAVNLVNTLSETFEQEIPNIMDVDNVSILSEAQLEDSNSPVSPKPILNLVIALLVGSIIGIGIALLLDFLDKSIKNEQDIERELDLPILGVVPVMSAQDTKDQKSESNNLRAKSRNQERKTS